MPIKFDAALETMMKKLDVMAATSERMVRTVVGALKERKAEMLQPVCADEQQMDLLQREVDDTTVEMIGIYTPVAADLRLLLMIARINGELERIGDQAVNISYAVQDLIGKEALKPLEDIPRMADRVMVMIAKAFQAFRTRSLQDAIGVLKSDDLVDQLHDKLSTELLGFMEKDPANIRRALSLLMVTRALERLGDHAVNIAEDTVYIITGKDIRHLSSKEREFPVHG